MCDTEEENENTCAICFETLNEDTNFCITKCKHKFHLECLVKCKGHTCPYCRQTYANVVAPQTTAPRFIGNPFMSPPFSPTFIDDFLNGPLLDTPVVQTPIAPQYNNSQNNLKLKPEVLEVFNATTTLQLHDEMPIYRFMLRNIIIEYANANNLQKSKNSVILNQPFANLINNLISVNPKIRKVNTIKFVSVTKLQTILWNYGYAVQMYGGGLPF